ncbi:MAG: nitroreductase family protein [Gammaproteobacteria bacterium]|nr:nitroreductase family protein [Gammaproteobacteria bacterium]
MTDAADVVAEKAGIIRDVILQRRSSRTFVDKPVPRDVLLELVEAGIYAPSGSNSQNQRFLIVDDEEQIARIGAARHVLPYPTKARPTSEKRDKHPQGIVGRAPALILVFADTALNEKRPRGEDFIWDSINCQNCAAAIENILLLATAKGLATCWISASESMSRTRLTTGYGMGRDSGGFRDSLQLRDRGYCTRGLQQVD